MVFVNCNVCGKKRVLSKANADKMLKANNGDLALVKENYTCGKCKAKKKAEVKEDKKEVKNGKNSK